MSIQSALPVIVGGVVVVVSSVYFCSSNSSDKDAILNNMGEPGAPPANKQSKKKKKAASKPSPPEPPASKKTSSAPEPAKKAAPPPAPKPTPAETAAPVESKKKGKKGAASKAKASPPAAPAAAAAEATPDPEYPPAPAPVKAAPAPAPAAPAAVEAPSKKNKKKNNGAAAEPAAAQKPAATATAAAASASSTEASSVVEPKPPAPKAVPPPLEEDGWESVTKKIKKPKAKDVEAAAAAALEPTKPVVPGASFVTPQSTAAAAAPAVAAPVVEATPEKVVLVDPKKVGVVIGPKGATLKRIEDVSGCRVDVQPSEEAAKSAKVKVTGPDEAALRMAEKMITELCSKGYSAKLAGESGFVESILEVPPRSVPDLIGAGGSVVKALRDACGVHVNFPTQVQKLGEAEKPAKVVVAGPKEGVTSAKEAIKLILHQYYSPVTHPGMTHAEFNVDEWQIARFCGRAGSNIRHIQGDSKARVYVPREWSQNKSVVVVGTSSQVAVATKHVKRILEGIAEEVKAKDTSEEAMAAAYRAGKAHDDDDDEEPYEEWMGAYLYKR